jgi:hypothetical protein
VVAANEPRASRSPGAAAPFACWPALFREVTTGEAGNRDSLRYSEFPTVGLDTIQSPQGVCSEVTLATVRAHPNGHVLNDQQRAAPSVTPSHAAQPNPRFPADSTPRSVDG